MLAKITLYDGTVYKIASQTVDTEDGIYLGRIKDELSLVSAMQEAGNAPETISLTIINYDNFIPHNKDLWAAEVLLTSDSGISWRGKINFCNFDSDGNLYVTASEKTAPELELQMPDEVRQVYTVDEDFHQSSVTMTIPLVIGGTTSNPILLPTILIDKTEGVYLICVGEIRSVVKVYNGTEELPNTAYTAYTGTSSQAEHAGFAYVKINEDYRLNADGSYAEINVEVVGLKLANFTEEECRNGALFLYYFLTTAATGVNGWGCGIDPSEIDTASFQSAITLCNQLGYKLDGIMWLRQSAQSWIDQICQAIHGKYSINANGKRSLFIDYAGNASKKTFTASNMQVDKYGKNSYTSVVYNKGILSYDYNPITGLFMQSAQYENAESIAQIGEQKFVGESYLLKDPTTALAVLEYTCKRSQTAAEAIEFETDDIETNLRAGDVITINRPDLSINNALYQIQNISITDYEASISAVKFDTSVFSVTGTASTVNWGSEKAITPALTPAMATSLYLSTGFDINPDGTGTPYISGTFTVPDGGWLAAAVQYGIGANPSNWTELALITEGRFKLSPVNVDTVYSIRVRMITATGHSDYLRGQITATGDTIPPAEPTIAVHATDKTVTVQCGLDNPPYDMGGFQIYRKKSTEADSAYTLIAMVAANRGYASYSDYVSEYITYNYKAKSYDKSGNLSTNFSNVASVTVTGIQANDVAATALAMPTGSILRLSAKNCTTASIAEANGVKDVSGNGNHLRAYGDLAIVKDEVFGECFSFDGSNDYIYTNESRILNQFNNLKGLTISVRIKADAINDLRNILEAFISGSTTSVKFAIIGGKIMLAGRRVSSDSYFSVIGNTAIEANKSYVLTGVFDYENAKVRMYINAELDQEANFQSVGVFTAVPTTLYIGKYVSNQYFFDGIISDFRIYPRALSASEIKTLYMFPDDVTFGQMTADLIGANIIKASNLVYTENIITQTAQIKDAIITNAKISDLNASKINAGTLDAARIAANAITAEKLNVGNPVLATVIFKLNFNGWSETAVDSVAPNMISRLGLVFKIAYNAADGHYNQTRWGNSCCFYYNNKGTLLSQTTYSLPANFTFVWAHDNSNFTNTPVLLQIRPSDSAANNAIIISINTSRQLVVRLWNSSQTESSYTFTDRQLASSGIQRCAVRVNGSELKVFICEAGDSPSATIYTYTKTITSRASQTMTRTSVGNAATNRARGSGHIYCPTLFGSAVNDNDVVNLLKGALVDNNSGLLTADRIAAGCVETRHLTADAIVGKTFQTASNTGTSNAAGVRFNSSGIQGFNGSAKTFDLSTNGKLTCSDVDLTGKITATSGSFGDCQINTSDSQSHSCSMYLNSSKNIPLSINATGGSYGLYMRSTDRGLYVYGNASGVGEVIYGYNGVSKAGMVANFLSNGGDVLSLRGADSSHYGIYVSSGKTYSASGWSTSCDESVKKDIKDVSTLDKLKSIRVKKFKYSKKAIQEKEWCKKQEENLKKGIKTEEERMPEFKDDENAPDYIMAMAGEFNKAFGVDNGNEEEINYTNAIGVCMRAIQELAEISDAQRIEIDSQKAEIAELKAKLKIQQDEKSDVEQEIQQEEQKK